MSIQKRIFLCDSLLEMKQAKVSFTKKSNRCIVVRFYTSMGMNSNNLVQCEKSMQKCDSHDHHHHSSSKVLFFAVFVTLVFALVEAGAGWLANSLALIGDAGHMASDATALALAAFAAWIAKKPPSKRFSYGPGRVEVLAALVNALLMLAIVGGIVVVAMQRFSAPLQVEGKMVMVVALIGLLVNILGSVDVSNSRLLRLRKRQSRREECSLAVLNKR